MQDMGTPSHPTKSDDKVKSGLYLIACALVFLAGTYYMQPEFYPLYLDHTETVGTITAVDTRSRNSYRPIVTYRNANGATVTFESRMHATTNPNRYKIGMAVPVIYTDFQGERLSMIKDFSSMFFIFGMGAGIAAFLALNGIWLLFKGRQSRREETA
jgi:hypothetical protein